MELPYDVTWITLLFASLGALSLGVSKAGVPGLAIVNVLVIAELFGAKNSVGIILPLLIICDLLVLPLFWKHATWRMIWPLVPVTFLSIAASAWLLHSFDDLTARRVIGAIIILMLAIQIVRETKKNFLEHLPDSRAFRWISCGLIGVSTMLANAAGPIYSLYGLVHKMPKMEFLGIGARLFLLVNLFKVPFLGQIQLINQESLHLDLILLPALLIGIVLGRKIIDHIPQRTFEVLLYGFSAIAGVRMLFF